MENIKITIERAEVRNGSIIIKFKPDLLSGQTFAVNPFYDEGDNKNQLQTANFSISLTEDHGEIKNVTVNYNGYHSTKGYRQLSGITYNYCFDRKKLALDYVTRQSSPDKEYWNDHIKSLRKHWGELDPEFLIDLNKAIEKAESIYKSKQIEEAKSNLNKALENLKLLLNS